MTKGWQLFLNTAELSYTTCKVMNEKNGFALVRKPSSAVDKAAPSAKRILVGMVDDTLNLAKITASKDVSVAKSESKIAFLNLTVSQEKIYVGQTVIGQIGIYLRDDVQNIGSFRFSSTPADGFQIGKMVQGAKSTYGRAQIDNRAYTVIPISVTLTAVESGLLKVGPFIASAVVVLHMQNQSGSINSSEKRNVLFTTEEIRIQSLPLQKESQD